MDLLTDYLSAKYQQVVFDEFLYVGIRRQELYHIKDGKVIRKYDVSTAARGAGNAYGSNKTPTGLHTIESRIGESVPVGGVFREKSYTGKTVAINHSASPSGNDDIITRILTLQGEENGINQGPRDVDSFKRRIYIHGTPEEGLIGTPASHGCIRMKSRDVIDLFNTSFVGMKVVILNN